MIELNRKEQIIKERQFRELSIRADMIVPESRTVNCAFSSELPVQRWWGVEILDHSPGAIDMSRLMDGAPLLCNHDPEDQIGVVESAIVGVDRIARAAIRFSNTDGEKYFQDVKDGIRKKISVGYQIMDMVQLNDEQITPEMTAAATEVDTPIFRVTKWMPFEVSLVSIPADASVGIGRGAVQETSAKQIPIKGVVMSDRVELTPEQLKGEQERIERERVAEIEAVAAQYQTRIPNMDILKRDAIVLRQSVELFRGNIFTKVSDDKPLDDVEVGLSEKEKQQYSLRKLIASYIPDSKEKAEFERSCSDAVAAKLQRSPRGVFVPYDMQIAKLSPENMRMISGLEKRSVLVVGTSTLGGNIVGTQIRPESFIEILRNRMLMLKLGVQELPGLQQNVAIPKQSAAIAGGWVAENVAPSQSNPTFAQVTLSPKTFAGYTDYSRQLLLQSTPGVDGLVINDLTRVQALGVDKGILAGSGSAGQPTGITSTAGLTSPTITTFTWAMAVQFETDVATANADVATMSYVMTPAVRGSLKGKVKVSGFPQYMIENDGINMNGYPVYVTNQATAATILFGDFSQAIVGMFGTLDILVDPFTGSSAGTVRVTSFQSVDVGVRQVGAFSYGITFT